MKQSRSIREQVFEDQDGGYVSRMALSTLPVDLRWAKAYAPLAWRNPDGRTIILPQEIIDAIRTGA